MSGRPSTAPPVMLRDSINNCQRLSATLLPDDWDDTTPSAIQRRESGTLAASSVRNRSTRGVTSAPAAAPSQDNPKPERYYQSKEETSSPATTSESQAAQPPTLTPASAPSFPRRAMSDSPYPVPSLPRTTLVPMPISPSDDIASARPVLRVASNPSRERLLSPSSRTFSHANGVH